MGDAKMIQSESFRESDCLITLILENALARILT